MRILFSRPPAPFAAAPLRRSVLALFLASMLAGAAVASPPVTHRSARAGTALRHAPAPEVRRLGPLARRAGGPATLEPQQEVELAAAVAAYDWAFYPDQVSAEGGFAVAGAGDVNRDGFDDVIVGAWLYDNGQTDEGRAYVFHGSATGPSPTADWVFELDQAGANLGAAVGPAGDVDGDGYDDVIVGAFNFSNGQLAEGAAFVFHGSPSGLSTSPDWSFEGNQASATLGFPVWSAGDVNGDGYGDVVVGSYQFDNGETDEGAAFVFHGSPTGLAAAPSWQAEGNQVEAYFGVQAGTAGDVNGDGFDDLIVAAEIYDNGQVDEGAAFLYLGSASGLSPSPAWSVESDQAGAGVFGVGTAGDVNGDGYDDVVVGLETFTNGQLHEGQAIAFHGSPAGLSSTPSWSYDADQAHAGLGGSAVGAGDLNGDGFGDVVVGAWQFDSPEAAEGRAYVFMGSAAGLSPVADWWAEGNQAGGLLGVVAAPAWDVDGDGFDDLLTGAGRYDDGQVDEGAAFLFLGSAGGIEPAPGAGSLNATGPLVTVTSLSAVQIRIAWGDSCAGHTDFAVYEGTLGDFDSHAPRSCSTGNVRQLDLTTPSRSVYYLVVPRTAIREGSYGATTAGERLQNGAGCVPQVIAVCP